MEIREVFEDMKKGMGDKGFLIFIGAFIFLFVIMLLKDNKSGSELTTVTSVSSYPDAVTNANVIIDTLQESIEYSEKEIIDAMGTGFESTNDYINKGLSSITDLHEKVDNMGAELDKNTNITAMTYYEQMLEQGREGFINNGDTELTIDRALSALENVGFDTSKEKGTGKNGKLNSKPGSQGGGYTTFTDKEGV